MVAGGRARSARAAETRTFRISDRGSGRGEDSRLLEFDTRPLRGRLHGRTTFPVVSRFARATVRNASGVLGAVKSQCGCSAQLQRLVRRARDLQLFVR